MSAFDMMKSLFPKGKAFDMTQDTALRRFVKGLSCLPDDIKRETERTFLDLLPETTNALDEWEKQFQVLFSSEEYGATRREFLKSLWESATGGQSAPFLQSLLRRLVPEICVTENVPVRNPTDAQMAFLNCCNTAYAVCGRAECVCGYRTGEDSYRPYVLANDVAGPYIIPDSPEHWEQCFFVSGHVERDSLRNVTVIDVISVETKWRRFIEYLILKTKPAQTKALLYINWI